MAAKPLTGNSPDTGCVPHIGNTGMDAGFLAEIDWQCPWLAPLRAIAAQILQATDWRQSLNSHAEAMALRNHRGLPIRFVPQSCLPVGTAYEAFISATGCVPTRENLHDFFNALVWLTFPQIKVQLNALQATAIENSAFGAIDSLRPPVHRGRLRDAATIFDENAALLVVCDHTVVDSLRSHQWREVFVERRDIFGRECDINLFGHALMEKLINPYKAITAHAWPVIVEPAFFSLAPAEKHAWLDRVVTQQLSGKLVTSDFTPLPVLGVPGWWHCQDDHFYHDSGVFRPKRHF
jgi:hypothetical protein